MINGKKVIISLSVILLICFCVGCFSSEQKPSEQKPSEEVMKDIILNIELTEIGTTKDLSNFTFIKYQITNEYFSRNKGGGGESTPYNVDVNYKLSYVLTTNIVDRKINEINNINSQINMYKRGIQDLSVRKKELDKYYKLYGIKGQDPSYKRSLDYYNTNIKDLYSKIEETTNIPDMTHDEKEINRNDVRLYFVKKGDRWYGGYGWK